MADAGFEVARAHLADDPSPSDWSTGEPHLEGVDENAVTVVTEYDEEATFKTTSTGEYDGTKRRIKLVFSIESGGPKLVSWRELYE
jgi:hypothetical protein